MRNIGLHLRIVDTIVNLAQEAESLELKSFQCFLINQVTKKHIVVDQAIIQQFLSMRNRFGDIFVHGAYWINLCASQSYGAQYILFKELELARALECNYYILHPGSAVGWKNRMEGIDAFVRILNRVIKKISTLKIVLENTVHGGMTIGSNVEDLSIIRQKLDRPEQVSFCIDMAHAYAYGYDIANAEKQQEFIDLLESRLSIDAIVLIHLNDSQEKLASKRDKHAVLGEGHIGIEALRSFVQHKKLAHIPLMMELPDLPLEKQKEVLALVKRW
jgi:deoxyribonuclease IV